MSANVPQIPQEQIIEDRANKEIAMLDIHQKHEEMQANTPKRIDEKRIAEATEILQKYKAGKKNLEAKIVANEQFWKLRQWRSEDENNHQPATAWLWACIQGRYSDIMDSYPTCTFQPRQRDDKEEAEKLSSIVPVILAQNRYEETYSDVALYTLKHGGGAQGIFWDASKHNGLGDISVKKVDLINLFWEPGVTYIQDSQHVFHTELVSNNILEQRYPQCKGKLGGKTVNIAKYIYDDTVDTQDKSVVVDWYYHTEYEGKRTLQYVKYVNNIILFATENETKQPTVTMMDEQTGLPIIVPTGELSMAERGLYDHAMYPFVVQPLFPIEGSICGYGLTDIGRDTQIQIDRINKAVTDNTVLGASPRFFIKGDGAVNEDEYLDTTKSLVHVEGSIDETNIREIESKQLSSIYVDVLNQKIEELKFVTANQDTNNGIAPSGVTAASAIAALQETAGKNARSTNKTFYRAFREVCYQIVELIRQFYDMPRTFRIASDSVKEEFVTYSNKGLVLQQQNSLGIDMGLRKPEFDIEISAEKASPYKKMEINELALSFYNQGFFNPQMADQALSCLEMMDFSKKQEVIDMIRRNGTMQQMLLQYQQLALQLAQKVDPALAQQLGNMILQNAGQPIPKQIGAEEVALDDGEHPYVEKARNQARESTGAE